MAFSWATNVVINVLILAVVAAVAFAAAFAAVMARPICVLRFEIWPFVAASVLALAVTCVWSAASWELILARSVRVSEI